MKKKLFWLVLIVLIFLHHDWWFWSDATLLFGFLPIGLAYHIGISLAAGALWAVAVFYAMPEVFEADTEEVRK
jgi:hypothetical protein